MPELKIQYDQIIPVYLYTCICIYVCTKTHVYTYGSDVEVDAEGEVIEQTAAAKQQGRVLGLRRQHQELPRGKKKERGGLEDDTQERLWCKR